MNYAFIGKFFSSYGISTILIALACVGISFALDKLFAGKIKVLFKSQIPFACALIIQFAYDMIFVSKAFVFTEKAFAAGILSGSLAVIAIASISKIKRGEYIGLSATAILIEGLLDGIVPETCIAATAIALEQIIIDSQEENEQEELIKEIINLIKLNSDTKLSDSELGKIAEMILQSVNSI